MRDILKNQQNEVLKQYYINKEKKRNEVKEMNEYLRIQKANDILEHINENNERFNQFLKTKNDNYEKMKINNFEKNLNVKRMEQQKQFLRENLNEEIKEREKQILENKKKN